MEKRLQQFFFIIVLSLMGSVGSLAQIDSSESSQLFISPNPFEDQINLKINNKNNPIKFIRIIDIIGNEVAHIEFPNKNGTANYSLDFSTLKQSIYFCQIYTEKGLIETRKLLRARY